MPTTNNYKSKWGSALPETLPSTTAAATVVSLDVAGAWSAGDGAEEIRSRGAGGLATAPRIVDVGTPSFAPITPAPAPSRPSPLPPPPPRASALPPASEMPIVIAFDLETTGLCKKKCRIIEVAAVNVSDSSHTPMATLVNPGRATIPYVITNLTGISNPMVSAPAVPSFAHVADMLEEFIDEARRRGGGAHVLLVAHNARSFDAVFLRAEYNRLGRELPDSWRFVDTLPMARMDLKPKGVRLKLDALATHFDVGFKEGEVAHRAQADARVCGDVLQGLLGVSLDGSVTGSGDGDPAKLRAAAQRLISNAFSIGDTSKNSLRRITATAAATATATADNSSVANSKRDPGGAWGVGLGPVVSSSGAPSDMAPSTAVAAVGLDNARLEEDEASGLSVEDEDDVNAFDREVFDADKSAERSGNSQSTRKNLPFWVAADPINGFLPETMDFTRIFEADERAASGRGTGETGETGETSLGGYIDATATAANAKVHALLVRLRTDHSAWQEVDVEALGKHGVPPGTVAKLRKEGIHTLTQVLRCYPREYVEYARWTANTKNNTNVLVMGHVVSYLKAPFTGKFRGGGKGPATLLVEAGDGVVGAGQHMFEVKLWDYISVHLERTLVPGAFMCVRGVLTGRSSRGLTLDNPTLSPDIDRDSDTEVVPRYRQKGEMKPHLWPDVQTAAVKLLTETLPADPLTVALGMESSVLPMLNLVSHVDAMSQIHAPKALYQLFAARERLAFEELLLVQAQFLDRRYQALQDSGEGVNIVSTARCDELRSVLDFSLTAGQEAALEEILHDMAGTGAMLRLLQGDVGCGKTVVAALGILAAVGNGHQGAMMAPTEVLAQQHARTLEHLFSRLADPPKIVLLTGSMLAARRRAALSEIADGSGKVIIGTHALISEGVHFKSLGLAVVDEQHKFGVEQRAKLMAKGPIGGYVRKDGRTTEAAVAWKAGVKAKAVEAAKMDGDALDAAAWAAAADDSGDGQSDGQSGDEGDGEDVDAMVPWRYAPHMLGMSATPIPRTVVMCKYGEMALSSIDEKPAGREPIVTRVLERRHHDAAYAKMVEEVALGYQAFVVFALVNDSDAEACLGVQSATEQHTRLAAKYPQVSFGLLHGQLTADEKASALEKFSAGHTQVLVTTTVIEVGVDVPNASLMIIEDVERHGLAQLHQMRGRVGRGPRRSHCYLLAGDNIASAAIARLRVLESTNNGFRIAENDLRARGPGEFFGKKQSGTPMGLFHASLTNDVTMLDHARKAAAEMIARSHVRGEPSIPAPLAVQLQGVDTLVDLRV